MLSHCANPQCSRPFLRLRQGKLFLVETECEASVEAAASTSTLGRAQPRLIERYWLCDQCAAVWTLVHDRREGIVLVPLPRPPVTARVAIEQVQAKTA
jgi:hypothetical protein